MIASSSSSGSECRKLEDEDREDKRSYGPNDLIDCEGQKEVCDENGN
jgi:hypothetical protein